MDDKKPTSRNISKEDVNKVFINEAHSKIKEATLLILPDEAFFKFWNTVFIMYVCSYPAHSAIAPS